MKSLKSISLICLLFLSANAFAQGQNEKPWIDVLSIKNHPTLGKDFKQKAIALVEMGNQLPAKGLGNFEIQDLMSTVKSFEQAALNGKGQDVIMPMHIRKARKKYSGNGKHALNSRLRMHMKQMERVFEDE